MKPGSGEAAGMVAKALDLVTGMVAYKVAGPAAAGAAYGARVGQRALIGGIGAGRARRSFEGGAPRLAAPLPEYAPTAASRASRGLGALGSSATGSGY